MSWRDTVNEKINELELIASWASTVGLGGVRDSCRTATSYLRKELARLDFHENVPLAGDIPRS